ncbi:hypothetical protein ACLOJK_017711 [Asimina triloba]
MGRWRRRRGRRELEDESWESSDEEYVVDEEGEWDGGSVSGEESWDSGLRMSLFGNRESEAEQGNSCGVSRAWEGEEEENKARTGLESKQRGAFACRRKRSCRKSRVSKVFNGGKEGCEQDRNLEAEGLCGVVGAEGNMGPTASQLKPMKELVGQRKSRAIVNNSIGRKEVSDDDDGFTSGYDEHVQIQEEKRDKKRRARVNSDLYPTDQVSLHVEDMGSEETGDSTSLGSRLSKRLPVDVSWNHLRQKRSARQSHSVRAVSDHEAFKLSADGDVDVVGGHWGKKRKRVQLPRSTFTSAVGSGDAFGVENEALTAEQKKRGRRKRRIILYSDSESEDSLSPNTATKAIGLQEEEDVSKEAKGCEDLPTCLSSSASRRLQVGPSWSSLRRKRFRKKGTRKTSAGMQVCGICLSEEHSDIVRGMLDSCSHYFCFTCIMEWSRVESRCPVCKQRFITITKPVRLDVGVCPMKEVITIPERNQVYQPSEEEVRSYFDPYENVAYPAAVCTAYALSTLETKVKLIMSLKRGLLQRPPNIQ